jgi:hypothetical protein
MEVRRRKSEGGIEINLAEDGVRGGTWELHSVGAGMVACDGAATHGGLGNELGASEGGRRWMD